MQDPECTVEDIVRMSVGFLLEEGGEEGLGLCLEAQMEVEESPSQEIWMRRNLLNRSPSLVRSNGNHLLEEGVDDGARSFLEEVRGYRHQAV